MTPRVTHRVPTMNNKTKADISKAVIMSCEEIADNGEGVISYPETYPKLGTNVSPNVAQKSLGLNRYLILLDRIATALEALAAKGEAKKAQRTMKHPIVFTDTGFEGITADMLQDWTKACPMADIDAELAKMAAWLKADPKRKKKNYASFILRWLCKVQDKGGNGYRQGLAPEPQKPSMWELKAKVDALRRAREALHPDHDIAKRAELTKKIKEIDMQMAGY